MEKQNKQYAAGKIGEQPISGDTNNPYVYSVRSEGRLKTVKEFGDIILKSSNESAVLKLKDVAEIELGAQNYSFNAMLNGQEAVPMLIFLQNDGERFSYGAGGKFET